MGRVLYSNPGDSWQCDRLTRRNSEKERKRVMPWFEYDGPNNEGMTERGTEMKHVLENMPSTISRRYYGNDFTFIVWDGKASTVEVYVFDDGRPTVWYFGAKNAMADFGRRKVLTVGENTAVAARWIHKLVKRFERKEESARLANDFILCLEEMRCSEKGSTTWECALSDARDRLTDLCTLGGVPAEQVIGSDI